MAEQRRWYFCQDDSGLLPGGDRLRLGNDAERPLFAA